MSGTGRDAPNVTNTAALNMAAFRRNLPGLINIINKYATPTAQANLGAEQAVTPGYLQLLRDKGIAAGQLQTDVLGGAGREQSKIASEIDRGINPEFYSARESGLKALLGNIDRLNPDNAGAQVEAERLVNQENARTGNLTAPASGTSTVANALQFGDERLKRISALDKALNTANSFMQSSRATFDPFGRSVNSSGNAPANFTDSGAGNGKLGSDLLNNIFGYTGQKTAADAQQKSYIDKIGESSGAAAY